MQDYLMRIAKTPLATLQDDRNPSIGSVPFNANAKASGVLQGLAKMIRRGLTPLLNTCIIKKSAGVHKI